MRRSAFQRQATGRSISRLCREVSEVLNRVRTAFGTTPMKGVDRRLEIQAAEAAIERAAEQLQTGAGDPDAWQRALAAYEAVWMAALKELRRAGKRAA